MHSDGFLFVFIFFLQMLLYCAINYAPSTLPNQIVSFTLLLVSLVRLHTHTHIHSLPPLSLQSYSIDLSFYFSSSTTLFWVLWFCGTI